MKKICILDYNAGNLYSIYNAVLKSDCKCIISSKEHEILSSDGLILPGVGSFPRVMSVIKKKGLDKIIKKFIKTKKPVLGTCLGMQILFSDSCEFKKTKGLGIFKGKILKLPKADVNIIPNIGWNNLKSVRKKYKKILNNYYYFVHSYYVSCDKNIIQAYTKINDFKFCSAVGKDNIFATQFHLEKSGKSGLDFIKQYFK